MSDAIRTSLGPRGMDKMVSEFRMILSKLFEFQTDISKTDPSRKRRSDNHKRWRNHFEANECTSSGSKNAC